MQLAAEELLMENSSSGQPSTPSATPAAAPAEASSSTVQLDQQPLRTPLDLRRAIAQMAASTPKPGSQPKPAVPAPVAEAPAVEATPAEAATETPTEGEATPPADGATEQPAEATPEADAEPETEDDGGEGPITPVTGKRAHLRLGEDDQVGRLAASYMKRNRDLGMAAAVAKAQQQLGIKPEGAPVATPVEDPKIAALPKTVDEVDSATAQLLADYKKAMQEVRFEDAADMQEKLMKLTLHRSQLERRAENEQHQQVAKYHADFDASTSKAVDLYPFAAEAASPGYKRMVQIDAQLRANGDPLYHAPNKPLKLAQMVAAELNIAPRNKNAAPAQKAAAAVTPPAPKKGVVPSGSSRTTPPAQNQPAVDPAISGIKTMTDLRTQLRRLGVK
jgi:hypothetical protein